MATPPPPPPPLPPSSSDPTSLPAPVPIPPPVPTAALVLAGGPATRMGYPKHLLKLPNGQPLYLYVANVIHQACPHLGCVYISLAEGSYLDEDLRAQLKAHPGRPAQPPRPMTTVNADNTAADAAVIGLDPDKRQDHSGLQLQVIWDKRTPILHPPPTRAQQRREEKKRSRERPEKKTHKNRSTSSSKRRAGRLSEGSVGTAPTTPVSEAGGPGLHGSGLPLEMEQDGDVDALGGIPVSGGHNHNNSSNSSSGGGGSGSGSGIGTGSAPSDGDGPIRGFLAAHEAMPDATWLVIACDYPRITVSAIQYLVDAYEPPVTCYRGARNKMEPLVSIWSPEALARLKQNCDPAYAASTAATGSTDTAAAAASSSAAASPVATADMKLSEMNLSGDKAAPQPTTSNTGTQTPAPTRGILGTIRQLHGKAVEVPPGGVDDIWMYNVNTPGNWDTALELYDI